VRTDKEIREWYSNGQLEWHIPLAPRWPGERPKLHGAAKQFYPTGELKTTIEYEYGKVVSEEVGYFRNGKIRHRLPFVNGRKEGIYKTFREDGTEESETNYENGKIKGKPKRYGRSGKART